MRRCSWWALLILLLVSCDPQGAGGGGKSTGGPQGSGTATDKTGPEATAKPAELLVGLPKLKAVPALRKEVVRSKGDKLATVARPLMARITPSDSLTVALRWEALEGGALDKEHPVGKQKLALKRTWKHFRVQVQDEGGTTRTLEAKAEVPEGASKPGDLAWFWQWPDVLLRLDDRGVHLWMGTSTVAWTAADTKLFPKAGSYLIRIGGALQLDEGAVEFETADIPVEVQAPSDSFKTLAELDKAALKVLKERLGPKNAIRPAKEPIEDVKGNRVLRYRTGGARYDTEYIEVVLAPAGKVLSASSETVFTCVAAGTPIATPQGPSSVESLRVGDELWGYDVEQGVRVPTTIRAIAHGVAGRMLAIGPELRVTDVHPIYANGQWMAAGQVRPGASLLSFEGAPSIAREIREIEGPTAVFDLSVDWPHTFFAAGILVHNKAVQTPKGRLISFSSWDTVDYRPEAKKPEGGSGK